MFLCDSRPGDGPPGHYGWRLVAANHRPLGRGIWAVDSLVECRNAAHVIHHEAARLRPTLTSQDGVWSWQLELDDLALAVCVHGYMRRIECARGLTQFLSAVHVADPDNGVVRHFGPHSLRGYLSARQPHEVPA